MRRERREEEDRPAQNGDIGAVRTSGMATDPRQLVDDRNAADRCAVHAGVGDLSRAAAERTPERHGTSASIPRSRRDQQKSQAAMNGEDGVAILDRDKRIDRCAVE